MRLKNLFLAVIFVLSLFAPAYGADQRIQYNEKMVGANHPTLADTLNRLTLVEHNTDGTHNKLTKVTDPWVDVRAYGAKGDGVTDDTAAIQAALNSGAFVIVVPKSSSFFQITSITVPQYVTLFLNGGQLRSSAATGMITLALGSNGSSAALVGISHESLIVYNGTDSAVKAIGAGESGANLTISHVRIVGSSAGISGINIKAFNRALIDDVEISGFTTGSGIKNEGTNSVTIRNPDIKGNLYGIWNLTAVVSAVNYSSNAVFVFGGQIRANTGYGIFEDTTGGGGTNLGNGCFGVTFEVNGTNGSATSGNVFLKNASSHKYIGNYFEYGAGVSPTNGIIIGDATNTAIGTSLIGNVFLSVGATNTINNFNGQTTYIEGNTETAVTTNFVNNGTLSSGLYLGQNGYSSTNKFAGFDTGSTSYLLGVPGTQLNAFAATIRGFGFNQISGLNQDLVIRSRAGATNTVVFQKIDGTQTGTYSDGGILNLSNKFYPGTDAGVVQSSAGIYAGTGAPNNANGANGDFYFNAAGGAATTIYQKRAGAWVGIL